MSIIFITVCLMTWLVFCCVTFIVRSPGHFLFLQVRESNSLREASIQSSFFPAPVSTTACQVSYLDGYISLIICLFRPLFPCEATKDLLKWCLFFCADAFLSVPVWGLKCYFAGGYSGKWDQHFTTGLGEKRSVDRPLGRCCPPTDWPSSWVNKMKTAG